MHRPTNTSAFQPQAPGPGLIPLLRSLQSLRENPLTFLQESAEKYGDIVQFRLGGLHAFLLNKPEYIQQVLQTNNHNYSKDTLQYNALAAITGRGLLTSDGELWLRQRRRMQPAFHRERTLSFGPLMVDAAVNMLEGWEAAAASGQVLDLDQELMRLALEILGKALLGVDLSREAPTLTAAVTIALDHIVNQLKSPQLLPDFIPTRANRQFQQAIRTLNRAVQEIIDKHVPGATETSDLLSLLITAGEKADGPGMDARQLRDEVITILIAGHETVASALTWTCYLMAQHPAAVERMVNELEQTLKGRLPCVEDLTRLEYTRQVFDESLRLYPPAWLITRKCLEEDKIGAYRIPAGSLMVIGVSAMHHHPAYWPDPQSFDPERFNTARSAGRPRFAYLPFGGGPRLCIGSGFALTEAPLVLACIFQRFRLELPANFSPQADPLVTLRPHPGIPVRLHRV